MHRLLEYSYDKYTAVLAVVVGEARALPICACSVRRAFIQAKLVAAIVTAPLLPLIALAMALREIHDTLTVCLSSSI